MRSVCLRGARIHGASGASLGDVPHATLLQQLVLAEGGLFCTFEDAGVSSYAWCFLASLHEALQALWGTYAHCVLM